MKINELKEKIKSSDIGGAYIFAGYEDYLKKYYLGELSKIACADEAFAVFNRVAYDGEEVDFSAITEAITSAPMMSDFKLIECRYADIDAMSESKLKALEELAALAKSYPYAVLVFLVSEEGFNLGRKWSPSKLFVRLSKSFSVINFEKSTDSQLISWLGRHFASEKISAAPKALSHLLMRSGRSMSILRSEVAKLCAYIKQNGKDTVTEADIDEVCSFVEELDTFSLSSAITNKNRSEAMASLADLSSKKTDAVAALSMLSRSFGELVTVAELLDEGRDVRDIEEILGWSQGRVKVVMSGVSRWGSKKLKAALARLRELDAASKSGGISGFAPIEIFISQYF